MPAEPEYARPVVTLFEAGSAAERLGVSPSGLRRLAVIYEEVHGELPRRPKSNNRLWPEEALERLQAARRLLEQDKCKTIFEALEALERGVTPENVSEDLETPQTALRQPTEGALQVLIAEIQALRREVAELRQERQLEPATKVEPKEREKHGVLVRLAMWVEQKLLRREY
jgi:DNA-binding transcriptional MerR regulator